MDESIFLRGYDDFYRGVHTNPFPEGTDRHGLWQEGYEDAAQDDAWERMTDDGYNFSDADPGL